MKTRADQQRVILADAKRREQAKSKLANESWHRYRLDCVAASGCKVTMESRTQ